MLTSVAQAETALQRAQEAHSAAVADHGKVKNRLTALQSELDAIQQRRLSGETQPDDAARVELLNLDIQGVSRLAAQAQARVDAAQGQVQTAQAALQYSQRQWEQHQVLWSVLFEREWPGLFEKVIMGAGAV